MNLDVVLQDLTLFFQARPVAGGWSTAGALSNTPQILAAGHKLSKLPTDFLDEPVFLSPREVQCQFFCFFAVPMGL